MSSRPNQPLDVSTAALGGIEGDLIDIHIAVAARQLEDLLETLALSRHPINPAIQHGSPLTVIMFPAYQTWTDEIRQLIRAAGFPESAMRVVNMLVEIRTPTAKRQAHARPDGWFRSPLKKAQQL